MSDIKKQTGIRISQQKCEILKSLAEYLRINWGELVEMIIDDSLEGTSPFNEEELNVIKEIKNAKGIQDTTDIEDTIIFPAEFNNFNSVFMQGHWYSVSIADCRKSKIKYAAAYVITPLSWISHYAEVQSIVQYQNTSKYEIIFKPNSIKVLPNPLNSTGRKDAIRARRYTQINKLLTATSISQL